MSEFYNNDRRIVPFYPDEMYGGSSVLEELRKRSYKGNTRIDLAGVPIYVKTAFRRFLAHAESQGQRLAIGETLGCLAVQGLYRLQQLPSVRAWVNFRRQAESLEDLSAGDEVKIDRAIYGEKFELPDPLNKGRERWAFRCDERVRKALSGAGERQLGINASQLALVCVIVTLSQEPRVNPQSRMWMEEAIRLFVAGCAERAGELELRMSMCRGRR